MATHTDPIATLIGVDASNTSISDASDASVSDVLAAVRQDVYNRINSLRAELEIWNSGDKWLRRVSKVSKASMERDLIAISATATTLGTAMRAAFGPTGAVGRATDVFEEIRAVEAELKAAVSE